MTAQRGDFGRAPWAHRDRLPIVNFGGFALMEVEGLAYDEVVPDRVARVLACGERRHLIWCQDMKALKDAMRADLRRTLDEFARSTIVDATCTCTINGPEPECQQHGRCAYEGHPLSSETWVWPDRQVRACPCGALYW